MTAEELQAFVADVRVKAATALARLANVEPEELTPKLREEYDAVHAGWTALLAMTEDDILKLHQAACEAAGRELTADELRGLLGRQ
jgi:hypothetical protein